MGLIAEIFKHNGRDYSNGGISSRVNEVTVVNVPGPFEPSANRPAVMLVPGNLPNTAKVVGAWQHPAGEWYPDSPLHKVGPMMGGCYVGTSDSRFAERIQQMTGSRASIAPLHDRFETQAQYNMLSN